jgi:hypothetical protein
MPPIRKAATTNATQPNTAVFQCRALQPPTLAARFRFRFGAEEAPEPVARGRGAPGDSFLMMRDFMSTPCEV